MKRGFSKRYESWSKARGAVKNRVSYESYRAQNTAAGYARLREDGDVRSQYRLPTRRNLNEKSAAKQMKPFAAGNAKARIEKSNSIDTIGIVVTTV